MNTTRDTQVGKIGYIRRSSNFDLNGYDYDLNRYLKSKCNAVSV